MQEREPRAVRAVKQMIEFVLGAFHRGQRFAKRGDFGERENEFLLAGFELDMPDAAFGRRQIVEKRIGNAGVAVAWPYVGQPAETGGDSRLAIWMQGVNGMRNGAPLARFHIEDS